MFCFHLDLDFCHNSIEYTSVTAPAEISITVIPRQPVGSGAN